MLPFHPEAQRQWRTRPGKPERFHHMGPRVLARTRAAWQVMFGAPPPAPPRHPSTDYPSVYHRWLDGEARRVAEPHPEDEMNWTVYLSGEIHTDWREVIRAGAEARGLPVRFCAPVTDHGASDDCGVAILGAEEDRFWHDRKGAGINAIRTRTLIGQADIVVVRFGDRYKQWNAAFDAGFASALGKPLVILHPPEHQHALKEVDEAARAVAETPEQVVEILDYVINGVLAKP